MCAPYPGRFPASQENLFLRKIAAEPFIHSMIKRKPEIFPGSPSSLPGRSILKPTSFMCTKSNPPGVFTQLHEHIRAVLQPYSARDDFASGCVNGPAIN